LGVGIDDGTKPCALSFSDLFMPLVDYLLVHVRKIVVEYTNTNGVVVVFVVFMDLKIVGCK